MERHPLEPGKYIHYTLMRSLTGVTAELCVGNGRDLSVYMHLIADGVAVTAVRWAMLSGSFFSLLRHLGLRPRCVTFSPGKLWIYYIG
jgi:hypothetical protein